MDKQQNRFSQTIFFPSVLHTIELYKIVGVRCMLEVDGDTIYKRIIKRLNSVDAKVCIDFFGIQFCSHQFLRSALGMLVDVMTIDEMNDHICLTHLTRHDAELLNIVMRHCATCFWEEKHSVSLNH